MKQIEYFAYTGQLEVWLASKGIDLVSAAPALEPMHEWCEDGTRRFSNHKVQNYREIPVGGRWCKQALGGFVVWEQTTDCPVQVSEIYGLHWTGAEALVRARPVRPVQPNQD